MEHEGRWQKKIVNVGRKENDRHGKHGPTVTVRWGSYFSGSMPQ